MIREIADAAAEALRDAAEGASGEGRGGGRRRRRRSRRSSRPPRRRTIATIPRTRARARRRRARAQLRRPRSPPRSPPRRAKTRAKIAGADPAAAARAAMKAAIAAIKAAKKVLKQKKKLFRCVKELLAEIDDETLAEIRSYPRAPPLAYMVVKACLYTCGHKKFEFESWALTRKLLGEDFLDELRRLDPTAPRKEKAYAGATACMKGLKLKEVMRESKAGSLLFTWVRNFMLAQDAAHEVAVAKQSLADLEAAEEARAIAAAEAAEAAAAEAAAAAAAEAEAAAAAEGGEEGGGGARRGVDWLEKLFYPLTVGTFSSSSLFSSSPPARISSRASFARPPRPPQPARGHSFGARHVESGDADGARRRRRVQGRGRAQAVARARDVLPRKSRAVREGARGAHRSHRRRRRPTRGASPERVGS